MLIIVATALLVIVFSAAVAAVNEFVAIFVVAAADFCIASALVLCCTQVSIFLSGTPQQRRRGDLGDCGTLGALCCVGFCYKFVTIIITTFLL